MDNLNLEKTWNESSKEDLYESQKFWDLRAEEFNNMINKQEEKFELVQYLLSKDAINRGYDVLDIGCGAGKYILEFAKIANDVTGIDISSKMISYAEQNVKNMNLSNANFKVIPWQDINLDAYRWSKKFDLVFASMSPAINSKETLTKMIEASKKYCFMSGFVYRRDKIKDELVKRIIGKNENKIFQKNIYCSFNALWNMGIYPEITYKDVVWNKKISVEQAVEMYTILLQKNNKEDKSIKPKIKSYLQEISSDGEVEESIEAKIAWMFWKIKE